MANTTDQQTRAASTASSSTEYNEKTPAATTATTTHHDAAAATTTTTAPSSTTAPHDKEQHLVPGDDQVSAAKERNELMKSATATSETGGKISASNTREDGTQYPTGAKLYLITLALCLAVLLIALDNSIIATAIPKITDQFNSLPDVGWYGSAYLLTTAALQLLFGKFYTFFDVKRTFLVAIGLFELGSLLCGAANSSTMLIVGRAIAGLGSAGIFSGALIILAHSLPLEKRPAYSGAIGAMYGISSIAGPLLGGAFTDSKATWRWCFYINLPIGAITVAVLWFFFEAPKGANTVRKTASNSSNPDPVQSWKEIVMEFDPFGTLVFMPAIICLLLALQWGGTLYAWNSGRIIALFVLFAVFLCTFIGIQLWQGDRATIPPRIIKKRTVWASAVYAFCIGSAFLSLIYFLPIWFQAVKGASAVRSGIMNLPMLISVVIFSLFAGGTVTWLGYYAPFMIIGTVLLPIGVGLLSIFTPDTPSSQWIGFQVIAGAGVGMAMQQPMMAVQCVLDIKDVPTGTSFIIFMQTLGGALFVSVSQNVFSNYLVKYVGQNVPDLNPAVVLGTGATSIQTVIPPEYLAGVTLAYNDALTKVFLVGAALSACTVFGSAFVEWKSVKGKKMDMAA